MSFLTSEGFCSLYPATTFEGIGYIVPLYVNGVPAPRHPAAHAIASWHQRGYTFVSRWAGLLNDPSWGSSSPINRDENYIGPDGCMHPDKERGSEDNTCFTFTFGDDDTPYKLGPSIYTTKWRVGWNFGGAWEGVMHPGTAFTFDCATGERFNIFPYITNLIELDPLGDVEL